MVRVLTENDVVVDLEAVLPAHAAKDQLDGITGRTPALPIKKERMPWYLGSRVRTAKRVEHEITHVRHAAQQGGLARRVGAEDAGSRQHAYRCAVSGSGQITCSAWRGEIRSEQRQLDVIPVGTDILSGERQQRGGLAICGNVVSHRHTYYGKIRNNRK